MENGVASSLLDLGRIELTLGGYEAAQALLEESLELNRTQGDQRGISTALSSLGLVALARGEPTKARTLLLQSVQNGQGRPLLGGLVALAHLLFLEKKLDLATQLYGAADCFRESMKGAYPFLERRLYDDDRELLLEQLGPERFQKEHATGSGLTREAVLALAA
jgi:tetratricopeptide (TPR) repeat protein